MLERVRREGLVLVADQGICLRNDVLLKARKMQIEQNTTDKTEQNGTYITRVNRAMTV